MYDRAMSGAELKVCVTGLGLTSQWLANQMGSNIRTVLRWYEMDRVPPGVALEIERITKVTTDEMHWLVDTLRAGGTLRTWRTDADARCSEMNTLPASWHRALTYRVLDYARSEGIRATIAYT